MLQNSSYDNCLPVYDKENNKIFPYFVLANKLLITKNNKIFNSVTDYQKKLLIIEELWETTFSASLIANDEGDYKYIKFNNKNKKILFLLMFNN